ncbi:hypothetical protein L1887_11202 [Cichorium endivia]|nr:hypothetical protein L1887_11202 [Cichorium endivia]
MGLGRDEIRQFRRNPYCFNGGEAKKPGQMISKGHKNYELMLNLQLGIRFIAKTLSSKSEFGCPISFIEINYILLSTQKHERRWDTAECTHEEAFSVVGKHIIFAIGSPFKDVDLGSFSNLYHDKYYRYNTCWFMFSACVKLKGVKEKYSSELTPTTESSGPCLEPNRLTTPYSLFQAPKFNACVYSIYTYMPLTFFFMLKLCFVQNSQPLTRFNT